MPVTEHHTPVLLDAAEGDDIDLHSEHDESVLPAPRAFEVCRELREATRTSHRDSNIDVQGDPRGCGADGCMDDEIPGSCADDEDVQACAP
ncbi:hypothetical protein [Raineyella antarctica]|uniref:hypothetical protein n=1 Tax=Raineyella antarctica TaxID=1577474 RepID=UPI000B872188|nr:hypothetical protein [Raineyella antarctica]